MSSLHGLLLINKPSGPTSHDMVHKIRKILKTKEVGHTGTLDPIASGLMILCLGEATKISQYILTEDKSYKVALKLGWTSTTLDREGELTPTHKPIPSISQVHEAASKLVGSFNWEIPLYSAKKVDGKKLYELARQGVEIELPKKTMTYTEVKSLEASSEQLSFMVACEKGAFIRTWVDELGKMLGCGAYIQELQRLSVGEWTLDQATQLQDLTPEGPPQGLIPLEQSLPQWPKIPVYGRFLELIQNGQIPHALESQMEAQKEVIWVDQGSGKWLALGVRNSEGKLRIQRGFRY